MTQKNAKIGTQNHAFAVVLCASYFISFAGCALLGNDGKVRVEEAPPYLSPSQRTSSVEGSGWEEDAASEDFRTIQAHKKKRLWADWSWLQTGKSTTGMSSEAKAISERLERE